MPLIAPFCCTHVPTTCTLLIPHLPHCPPFSQAQLQSMLCALWLTVLWLMFGCVDVFYDVVLIISGPTANSGRTTGLSTRRIRHTHTHTGCSHGTHADSPFLQVVRNTQGMMRLVRWCLFDVLVKLWEENTDNVYHHTNTFFQKASEICALVCMLRVTRLPFRVLDVCSMAYPIFYHSKPQIDVESATSWSELWSRKCKTMAGLLREIVEFLQLNFGQTESRILFSLSVKDRCESDFQRFWRKLKSEQMHCFGLVEKCVLKHLSNCCFRACCFVSRSFSPKLLKSSQVAWLHFRTKFDARSAFVQCKLTPIRLELDRSIITFSNFKKRLNIDGVQVHP